MKKALIIIVVLAIAALGVWSFIKYQKKLGARQRTDALLKRGLAPALVAKLYPQEIDSLYTLVVNYGGNMRMVRPGSQLENQIKALNNKYPQLLNFPLI